MSEPRLTPMHTSWGAKFTHVNGCPVVADYGDLLPEYRAYRETVAVVDLTCRSRLCVTGSDRRRFLHGQVTNDVRDLAPGQGTYAALVTAKGKMQSDLYIYCLANEVLLDFEPGYTESVKTRLEKYIIADDVEIAEIAALYGLLSLQGPRARDAVRALSLVPVPEQPLSFSGAASTRWGEVYLMRNDRLRGGGYDLFVPTEHLVAAADALRAAVSEWGGRWTGWNAMDVCRVEDGIPRFGIDMDETNLPLEANLAPRAISFSKGCYIGQEVIARIRTYGHVNKNLCGLQLADDLPALPQKGDRLAAYGRDAGYITSAVHAPRAAPNIALGYVQRDLQQPGTRLELVSAAGTSAVTVVPLPFPL